MVCVHKLLHRTWYKCNSSNCCSPPGSYFGRRRMVRRGEVPRSTARREAREARIDPVALLPLAPAILASPELQCFHRCHHSWVRIVLIITPAPRYTRLGSASRSAHGKGVPALFSVVLPPYYASLYENYRRLILSSTVGPSAPPPAFVMVLQVIESSRKDNYEEAP